MKVKAGLAKKTWDVSGGQIRVSFWILLVSSLAITKIGVFCWNHAIQVPQYRVSHWVVPSAHPSGFPVVWEGDEFKVLEVR